tara:strand:+ start:3769 stop:4206 length:438 start_codon:yes stop_codon:yes gene_type:complete
MLNIKSARTGQKHINDLKLNDNSDFDLDLKFGQKHERKIAKLLGLKDEQIEVKTERDWWASTKNICIEVERRGKPSGLSVTKAKVWVHVLSKGNKQMCRLVLDVSILKKLVEKFKNNWKMVGDRKETKAVLIKWKEIINALAEIN